MKSIWGIKGYRDMNSQERMTYRSIRMALKLVGLAAKMCEEKKMSAHDCVNAISRYIALIHGYQQRLYSMRAGKHDIRILSSAMDLLCAFATKRLNSRR